MGTRRYSDTENVYEAAMRRLDFVFTHFDRVYLSFSGGKDSGVLMHLALQYMRENGITDRKLGVQIMDNEANYEYTVQFMRRMIEANRDLLDVYWCCLPITLPCTVSSYEVDWRCWGESERDRWVRPRPEVDYVITFENHPFPWFYENMPYYEFWDQFAEWYSNGESCANLIGIRAAESLNRFRAIVNDDKEMRHGQSWTKLNTEHTYNCYPIYDWRTEDIWKANAVGEWDYNYLYDVFYLAGVPVSRMRVASPFMSESKSSLNLYRVIDPQIWARLCGRVQGANFIATYGKQIDYKTFKLPEGHTWRSFVKFLLDTLPEDSARNFRQRIVQSIKYWARVGRGLSDDVIAELKRVGVYYRVNGTTPHGGNNLRRVRIPYVPDHLDNLKFHNAAVTSWKRFAITILKNDHQCKYMGLAPTQEQQRRQKEIQAKYSGFKRM